MTQRSSVTIKVSNSNESGLDLKLSSNMISNSNDETNFLYELLVTDRQVANLRKTFANNLLTNIKLSKLQISKIIQSCEFFGRLLGPLMKIGTPLMKNVLQALGKSVLIALGITTAAGTAYAGNHKKIIGLGHPSDLSTLAASLLGSILAGKGAVVTKQG